MAATPQYAVFTFVDLRTKKSRSVDAYISDVAGALVRFDAGDGSSSTSPDFWVSPGYMVLNDISIVTGTADTTKIQLTKNGTATGDFLRYAMHLTTLARRPNLTIGVGPGQVLRAVQRA